MGDSSFVSGFKTGFGSAFLQSTMERFASLCSFAGKEISVIWGVEEELQRLQRTFFKIQKLVDDVDGSSVRIYGGSNAWQQLFEKLRKLGYDADALLDHISLHLSTYCAHHSITSNQERQLRPMVLSSLRTVSLPREILAMQRQLDELAIETERLVNIESITLDDRRSSPICIYALKEPSFVVGRDKDKECIVNLLSKNYDTTTTTNYSVISIMGMGGIGKTTVARLAYNEAIFEKKIWVSLSVDFDVIKITKSIIEFATLSACNLSDLGSLQLMLCNLSDLGSLQLMLQNILRESKFLIVLDDYWSENCDDWDTLSGPFQSGSHGSKVIVTTRNMKISRSVCSSEEHILEILSDDDCWEVIKHSAMMTVESSQNLKSVGMQIAKKCKGVPLVATTLGNMLRFKSTEEEWRLVLERELWEMLQLQENNILFHLMQSYVHLPTHLQKCFAYCSIFPQGHEFEMEELIFLWMAEGYIQPAQNFEGLVAKDCFNELYLRFFFHQCRTATNQIRYKMHDLIHGMSRLVSKDICYRAKHDQFNSYPLFGNACHLSLLHDGIQPVQLKASVKNERLRTFLVMSSTSSAGATTMLHPQLFSYLKFLRVLGLGGAGLTELVDSIEQLQYLRYLNLSDNPISRLPKSLCTILALQILKLRSCPNLRDLPEEMSSLINLKHLEFDEKMFTLMPPHFRKLVNLEYLSAYTVGKKNGCGIGELKSLNCLGGRLCIRKIEVSNATEAGEANLDSKIHLDKLELEWTSRGQHNERTMSEQAEVLANLRPHLKLKELVIQNYFGLTYPPWLSDASHNFKSIHLKGLKYCDRLPSLGELPYLTSFSISNMPRLELIDQTFYGAMKFPSLESFQLRGLSKLTHWEEANGNGNVMPCLRVFTLNDCQELSRLPENLQALLPVSTVSGCPRLQP